MSWLDRNAARTISFAVAALLALSVIAQDRSLERLQAARQLKDSGAAKNASPAYEELLPELRRSANAGTLAAVLFETSQVALALGDYDRAIARASEAAGLRHRDGDLKDEALAVNSAGLARLYRGDYKEALQDFQRSLRLHSSAGDIDGQVARLNNIGNVYFFQGKYLDALQNYERALQNVTKAQGLPWAARRRQLTLANLATLYEQLGQNEKALDYYQEALALGTVIPPEEYAQLLSNLGTLRRRMGDPVKALATYRSAGRLFTNNQHSDGQIHLLHNTGIVLALDLGDLPGALESFTKALQAAEATSNRRQIVLGHLFRAETLFRLKRFDEARQEFQTAHQMAKELGAAEELWTSDYGIGRLYLRDGKVELAAARFRDAIGSIESLRSGLSRSSLRSEFLAEKRAVYDAYIAALLSRPNVDRSQLFEIFERARSRNLQDSLRNSLSRATIASVQAQLGVGSMLVEYWVGDDQLAALWVTKAGSGLARVPFSKADAARMQDLAVRLSAAKDDSWKSDASWAGERLFSGIPLTATINHLLIVPDGYLNYLPFEVLQHGTGPLLLERFALSYLPSASLLLRTEQRPRPAPPWSRELIAFGDPLPPRGDTLAGAEQWTRLPESGRELREVAGALRGRAEIHSGSADLKRELLASNLAGTPLLHLSSHASVDLVDPNRSRILFTGEDGDDGSRYLFWREVQDLHLRGVELVTLSACDTGGGKMLRGEGIQSFSRAFLAAGAGSTVTTLWRVADRATADFMQIFYFHLARGEPRAEALRSAKLTFWRSGSDLALPGYWAAFVLNGDGQLPVRPVWSWAWLIVPVLVGCAALAGTIALLRREKMRAPAMRGPLSG